MGRDFLIVVLVDVVLRPRITADEQAFDDLGRKSPTEKNGNMVEEIWNL